MAKIWQWGHIALFNLYTVQQMSSIDQIQYNTGIEKVSMPLESSSATPQRTDSHSYRDHIKLSILIPNSMQHST
jgi:hypothetical protein